MNPGLSKPSQILAAALLLAGTGATCGEITYTLHLDGVDPAIRAEIELSMAESVSIYNRIGSFNKSLDVYYDPAVPTANANFGGIINFGGQRSTGTAMHEISHTLGVGTYVQWGLNLSASFWTGAKGIERMHQLEGPTIAVHADSSHFWDLGEYTYGLNQATEDGTIPRLGHVRMVAAFRADMLLETFFEEPKPLALSSGETAVFSVDYSPGGGGAATYEWYKQPGDIPLADGGDISGSHTDTLTLSNVDLSDEGFYYCLAGNSLSSRPARLAVDHHELFDTDGYTINTVREAEPFEIGSRFLTDSNPPTVRALGYIDMDDTNPSFAPHGDGLLQQHRVTLWNESTGTKVTEATVPAGKAGRIIGSFRYTPIPEGSVTLEPNTAYIVSASTSGTLDPWLDQEIVRPSDHFLGSNISDHTTWQARYGPSEAMPETAIDGRFYGVANLSTTAFPVMGSANFFTSSYAGTRNDYTGKVGYELVPTEDFPVDRLGRGVSGSIANAHEIEIWRVADQSLIASTTIDSSSQVDALNFAHAGLNQKIILRSGVAYRIVSSELAGGDHFRDFGEISNHLAIANVTQAAFGTGGFPANVIGPGLGYGPVTFYVSDDFDGTSYAFENYVTTLWGLSGADAQAESDFDKDGLPNAIEFVLGGDPTSVDPSTAPTVVLEEFDMIFKFRRSSASVPYNPSVEYGSDLVGWTAAVDGENGVQISVVTGGGGTGVDLVDVRLPRALAGGVALFARLSVSIPESP